MSVRECRHATIENVPLIVIIVQRAFFLLNGVELVTI